MELTEADKTRIREELDQAHAAGFAAMLGFTANWSGHQAPYARAYDYPEGALASMRAYADRVVDEINARETTTPQGE